MPRPEELRLYWARNPKSNVGIALRRVSGLVALDFDGPEGEKLRQSLALPPTLEFATANGYRCLFRHPLEDLPIKSVSQQGKEAVRLLTRGSQTVMPPSVHPSGVP